MGTLTQIKVTPYCRVYFKPLFPTTILPAAGLGLEAKTGGIVRRDFTI
jgi:hypothetical protein